jgi:hypothetical protein
MLDLSVERESDREVPEAISPTQETAFETDIGSGSALGAADGAFD